MAALKTIPAPPTHPDAKFGRTQIRISELMEAIAAGDTNSELFAAFPELTPALLRKAVAFAADVTYDDLTADPHFETNFPCREKLIVRDSDICGGEPIMKGTRIPLRVVLAALLNGDTTDGIVGGYPALSAEHVDAAVRFAAACTVDIIPHNAADLGGTA